MIEWPEWQGMRGLSFELEMGGWTSPQATSQMGKDNSQVTDFQIKILYYFHRQVHSYYITMISTPYLIFVDIAMMMYCDVRDRTMPKEDATLGGSASGYFQF